MNKFFKWFEKNEAYIKWWVALLFMIASFILSILSLFDDFKLFISVLYLSVCPFFAGFYLGFCYLDVKDSSEDSSDAP